MNSDRFLGQHIGISRALYHEVRDLPLVCPHGHVDPALLSAHEVSFPDPVSLLVRPDHYLLRMLYSQGLPLEFFLDEEQDPRLVWRRFA